MKEMTLDVQNVIAPPKTKVKVAKKQISLAAEGEISILTSDTESKPLKPAGADGEVTENGVVGSSKADDMVKSPVSSPSGRSSLGSPHDGSNDNHFRESGGVDSSPRANEPQRYAFIFMI